jgi:HPt (histidine-containing phosphotransfer) domain-containing protein
MLRRVGGEELLLKMVALFADAAAHRVSDARSALATCDSSAFIAAAHSLKSSAGQLGASKLQSICSDMEKIELTLSAEEYSIRLLKLAEVEVAEAVMWLGNELARNRQIT